MEMEWYWALITLIGMVVFFMAMGVPVAFTFLLTNTIGVLIFHGDTVGWIQNADNSTQLITRFTLGPVPIFIMMGALFFHSGLAIRVFDGLDVLFGKLPGRLCFLTVAADPELGIPWPVTDVILSPRDADAPPLRVLLDRLAPSQPIGAASPPPGS